MHVRSSHRLGILPMSSGIKAIVKHREFWYLTGHGDVVRIGGLPNNMGQWKNDFFFYPSTRSGKFKIGHKW